MTLARTRTLLGALLLAAMLTVLVRPVPAFACSCAMFEPEQFAAQQDAAFVGTLRSQQGESWTFEVEEVYAGELEEVVTVHSAVGDGGNCGLILDEGTRIGVGLYGGESGWETSSCSTIDADMLAAANEGYAPLPVTDTPAGDDGGGGVPWVPIAIVVVGTVVVFGGVAVLARRRPVGG